MSASQPKILIVDDEPQILRFLTYALQASGYATVQTSHGQEALRVLQSEAFDAVILDIGLPDMDGKAVIETLRRELSLPVIVLSAHDQEMQRIMALDLGADDFIAKPFGIGELLARLRACLRRSKSLRPESMAGLEGFGLDGESREAEIDGRRVRLTRREFDLIRLLAEAPGSIVRHRSLLERVWGPAHVEDLAYLRVFIGQLRRKLALGPQSAVQIQTEPGIGYRLMPKRNIDSGDQP
ncbi:response regulator transcription factor [Pseudogemmobacter faecipullorum]|uniref:Response regulator transcription factor n=1 Tax=Pseudogemmobacter faecipullorum TaxID=2755041 RepID=A0ABS8CMT2_9RHOB|nr:response regulator transcription factor [Pseudogemmobacter faecipullorum]MCB5410693.1 response regulator transcription factor [Pseudogemmobacter faecipullorum]